MGIASIIKKTPQTETRTRVSVRYDSILCMFIIQDRNNDKTLEPAMSVIDLLDRVYRDKLEIVDAKATSTSMTHYFTPKEKAFFQLNSKHGLDFTTFLASRV